MRYNEEVISKVIESNDIIDVISQYITLKKTGNSYKGKCPFHNEKTPSFSVSPEKQLYHCFGCGAGGNIIGFIMEIENMSFLEALEYLADRANITLPKETDKGQDLEYAKKDRLYELHRLMANHYYLVLKGDANAQRYLANRGFKAETIKAFGIGLSTPNWQDGVNYLTSQGFTQEELLESGLVLQGKNGRLYDRFRERIMIPILNIRNKIIGFGGRAYLPSAGEGPKYLNSPETLVFSKGYELYHLNEAKKKIANGQMIIVEGYMDVIALCQYGIVNVVAALGTAFTPYHAKTLSRYVDEVVLCFDGDDAGEGATQKAIAILKSSALNIRVIRLPKADDPDSFIRKNGVDAFLNQVKQSDTVMDFELERLRQNNSTTTSDGKLKYLNQALTLLRGLTNPMEQELYAKKVAQVADVSQNLLLREIRGRKQSGAGIEKVLKADKPMANIPKAYADAQAAVLKHLFYQPREEVFSALDEAYFSPGFYRNLFLILRNLYYNSSERFTLPMIMEQLEGDEDRRCFSELSFEGFEDSETTIQEGIRTVKYFFYQAKLKHIRGQIKALDDQSSEGAALMKEIMEIKSKLGRIQEANNGGKK